MGGFGRCCAARGPEFRAGAGAVDVEGGGGGGLLAVDSEGERRGEGVGGAHDGGRRCRFSSGQFSVAMSVEEAVWHSERRLEGRRHLVGIISPESCITTLDTGGSGRKTEGDCYYKPGLPLRKRCGDSSVEWSVQTAVGQGFYPVVFRGIPADLIGSGESMIAVH